ncbi:MAG TPA: BamA/TamA family outer membrane protein [Smithellaceae bacterium]|nr:BamA/TamA family outer membrane protein [Smithellaceae bacterium]
MFSIMFAEKPLYRRSTGALSCSGKRLSCGILLFVMLLGIGFAAAAHGAEPVEMVVQGVEGDVRRNVMEALTFPHGLIKDQKVDKIWLERFISQAEAKVLDALEPYGYYSARVGFQLEALPEERYRLRVKVDAGPPAILSSVQVRINGPGASESSLTNLALAFPLRKGDTLLHQSYEDAKQSLLSRASDLGYLDAAYAVHEISVDEAANSADIRLELQTGEKYFFSDITLEGAPDYPEPFLRRYLAFAPGDVFSYARLAETQLQLNNSERFREVTVLADKKQAKEYKVPVSIGLKPLPQKSLRPGVGYGTDTGARFSLRYRDLNVFHRGHELNSMIFVSERLQGLATSYILPGREDIRSFTSAQINLQRDDLSTYNNRIVSLELAKTRSFGIRKQGSVYVKIQQEEYTISDQDSSSHYVLPGIRFSDNAYDGMVRPSRGFRYALDLRGTGPLMGSSTQLLQLIGEASHLLPLPWRLSLATSTKSAVTFFSDPLSDLPPSLRFFAGGDQSVRGYAYQSLGPTDSKGNVVGGKHLLSGCIELQRAILKDWAASAFYNAGNAFDSFSTLTLYQAAGIGVHYFTPVGALNFSVARQINVENPGFRIHFTVGFEF